MGHSIVGLVVIDLDACQQLGCQPGLGDWRSNPGNHVVLEPFQIPRNVYLWEGVVWPPRSGFPYLLFPFGACPMAQNRNNLKQESFLPNKAGMNRLNKMKSLFWRDIWQLYDEILMMLDAAKWSVHMSWKANDCKVIFCIGLRTRCWAWQR